MILDMVLSSGRAASHSCACGAGPSSSTLGEPPAPSRSSQKEFLTLLDIAALLTLVCHQTGKSGCRLRLNGPWVPLLWIHSGSGARVGGAPFSLMQGQRHL